MKVIQSPAPISDEQVRDEPSQQEDAFAGPLCNQTVVLPSADFAAFTNAVTHPNGPNEKLKTGAEWFKHTRF